MTLEIALDADEDWDSSRSWDRLVRRAAEAAIAESAYRNVADNRDVELSVRLTSDQKVRDLNAQWRGKDRATNVLSFPLAERDELRSGNVVPQELLLGDIVLARGICAAEAAEKGISFEDHATHLIVHGTLHLLGYDHGNDEEAGEMESREVRALARLGVASPYEVAA